jgi:hypothetical protein
MSAIVLPFPGRHVGSHAVLAQAAKRRWAAQGAPMVDVAIEILGEDPDELHAKARRIVEEGATGLLAETDQALAETAGDLCLLLQGVDMAREKLRASLAACADPSSPPAA